MWGSYRTSAATLRRPSGPLNSNSPRSSNTIPRSGKYVTDGVRYQDLTRLCRRQHAGGGVHCDAADLLTIELHPPCGPRHVTVTRLSGDDTSDGPVLAYSWRVLLRNCRVSSPRRAVHHSTSWSRRPSSGVSGIRRRYRPISGPAMAEVTRATSTRIVNPSLVMTPRRNPAAATTS